jgi:hypothetical protein
VAWIEVHQELQNHPKVLMLRKISGLPLDTTLGRVLQLWLWGLAYASDGDLRKYDPGVVEEACNIPIATLFQVGLIDRRPYLRLHDWWDYAGKFLKIKFKNYPEKWMRIEELYKTKQAIPKNPLRTLTNQPNQPNQPTIWQAETWFDLFWKEYPRKLGKPEALKYFKADIKNEVDFKALLVATKNYKNQIEKNRTEERYILHGSTFCHNQRWKDYLEGPNGTNDSQGTTDFKALARAAREAKKAREDATTGAVSDGVRDTAVVPDGQGRGSTGESNQ